jgi:hypothetical protein
MKKILVLLFAALILVPGLALAHSVGAKSKAKKVDVDVIVDLLKAGVSDTSIERFVERNDYTLQLDKNDLIDLTKAGASDELVQFLQERDGRVTQEEPTQEIESRDENPDDQADKAEEPQTKEKEYDDDSGGSSHVYWSFGIGFGYPYYGYPYYASFYYPGYYYPAYPIYAPYPCHYYGGYYGGSYPGYPGSYPGGSSGTGVYSYWYRNQGTPKGRPISSSSGYTSGTNLSGRVMRTAPSPGSSPHVSSGRGSVTSRPSFSSPSRPSRGSSPGGMSRSGSSSRGPSGMSRSGGSYRGPSGMSRSGGMSGSRGGFRGGAPRSGGMGGFRGGGGFHGGGRGGGRH